MTPRRERAAWAAGTTAVVLLAFAPAVLGQRTLAHRDTDQLYAPVRTLVVEALRQGRLPLWNPHEATGKPLFAEGIHSVLHPVSLLGAAVAPSSIDLLILAYLAGAALGAFLLCLGLGASGPASAGAGLAFALSGYSLSMTGNLVFLAGLATLPWLVAAARSAGAGAPWGAVATALATGCGFLSGDVQVTLVGIALGLGLAGDAGGWRGAARALAGVAAGGLLAGVQLASTRALLPMTTRSLELTQLEKTQWALAPARLLEWVLPGLWRGPLPEAPADASGMSLTPVFAESVFLGAPLVVMAGIGLTRGRTRTRLVLGGASLALLWLAMGHHLGAQQLLDPVPIWGRFRYAEKLMAPLALCLCALGVLGVAELSAGRLGRGWSRILGAAAAVAALALAASHLAPEAARWAALRLLGDRGAFYGRTLAAGLPHLLIGALAILALDRVRRAAARTLGLAALLVAAPLAAVSWATHLGDLEMRRAPIHMVMEPVAPAPRLVHPARRSSISYDRLDFVEETTRHQAALLAPSANVAHRVDAVLTYGAFDPIRLAALLTAFGDGWAHAFRRFGLTHVALPLPMNAADRPTSNQALAGGRLVQRDEERGFELWSVPHRPWAFFAEGALAVQRSEDAIEALQALVARGSDGTVVVEDWEPPSTSPGRVLRIERGPETVRIEAEAEGPALLVVQDAWWPGWRATIDGRPATVLATDVLVRGIRWPAGRHRLELVYDPPELRVGLAWSALGALAVAALAMAALRSSRRAEDPGPAG